MSAALALERALVLAAAGYAVFPCGDDKKPACPKGFKAAVKDAAALRALWAAHPGTLIGVATGAASGCAVLDIDPSHPEAVAWHAAVAAALPPTFAYSTRRGGWHQWFRHPAGLRCSEGRPQPGVDVRADGGYAIYWPAHGGTIFRDLPPAEWPAWLTEAIAASPGGKRRRRKAADRPSDQESLKAPDPDATAAIVRAMPNDAFFDSRGSWLSLAHALAAAFADDPGRGADLWLEHAAKREQGKAGEPERVWATLQGPHHTGAGWIAHTAKGMGIDTSRHENAKAAAAFAAAGPVGMAATGATATRDEGGNGDGPAHAAAGAMGAAATQDEGGKDWADARMPDGRPMIQVFAGHLAATADKAERALVERGFPIYVREFGALVAPGTREVRVRGGGKATVAGLHRIGAAALRDMLSKAAAWAKWDGRAQKLTPCDPPEDVAKVLLERPEPRPWPEVAAVVSTPGLRHDGSVSAAAGYDAVLGVHRFTDPQLRLPAGWAERALVKADAEAALALLDGLLTGFPFVEPLDRSVALALILTCLCRSMVAVAPAFAVTATDAGTGKSHLVDLASAIATGRRCPAAGAGDKREETEKRLGGLVAAGYPIVSLDNVNGTLRSDLLSQAVERERLQIRLLGKSDMPEVESRAVFIVNGNGLRLSGDLVRRTLPCRMDAGMEQPESRSFAFDPVRVVEADRGTYVAAGLTMLRAHAAAGRPGAAGLRPLGSYGEWGAHVRGTLVWLGRDDPARAIEKARAEDPDLRTLRDMLTGWQRRVGGRDCTVREAVDAALSGGLTDAKGGQADEAAGRDLLDAMLRAAGPKGTVDAQRLGMWMNRNEGRVMGGLRFRKGAGDGAGHVAKWRVDAVRPSLRLVENT